MNSFRYAFEGIRTLFNSEANARIHLVAAIAAIAAGFAFRISEMEWIALTIVIALVIAMECVNTAIEKLCDRITTEKDLMIKMVKDLSAAGVLTCACAALMTGILIFLPKFFHLLHLNN